MDLLMFAPAWVYFLEGDRICQHLITPTVLLQQTVMQLLPKSYYQNETIITLFQERR